MVFALTYSDDLSGHFVFLFPVYPWIFIYFIRSTLLIHEFILYATFRFLKVVEPETCIFLRNNFDIFGITNIYVRS